MPKFNILFQLYLILCSFRNKAIESLQQIKNLKLNLKKMSKNSKEFALPEKQMKSKLDAMWNELQSNLPVINFDDHNEDKVKRDNFI